MQEYNEDLGIFVSQEHRHIAELIKQYDDTLDLIFIPPAKRKLNEEFPFAILQTPRDGFKEPYIVRKVRLEDMNADLLAWLSFSDNTKGMNSLAWMDAQMDARKALDQRAYEERMAEATDITASIIGGKNWYKHNGKVYS